MRTPLVILIAAVSLAACDAAFAQAADQTPTAAAGSSPTGAPGGAPGHQSEVIITGKRELQNKINTFVNQLTDYDPGDPGRGMGRWQQHICPLVAGLPEKYGEYVLMRISEIAQEAGAPLAGRHCHPNLFIVVSKEPQAFLQGLESSHRTVVFGTASPGEVNDFVTRPRPVRTWYNVWQRTPEGLPLVQMSFSGIGQSKVIETASGVYVNIPVAPSSSSAPSFQANPWSQASHLTLNVVWAIYRAFVIVDPTQFRGVTLGQLADYVAMSGLAQIKLNPDVGDAPSILTLFDRSPESASPGLTDWDRAFLKAFYKSEHRSVLQRREIALDMVRAMAP